MLIPLINPNRPPKKWWDHTVKTLSKDKSITDPKRLAGWIWYHEMSKKSKAKAVREIEKVNPETIRNALKNFRNGSGQTTKHKESSMPRRTRKRRSFRAFMANPARKRRSVRKNRYHPKKYAAGGMRVVSSKPARRRRRGARIAIGVHRPRLRYTTSGWKRMPKSKLFPHPTRINPRRRRHARRNPIRRYRRARRNPFTLKGYLNKQTLMQVASVGAGIAIGYMTLPLLYKVLPASLKNRKYLGLGNVALGLTVGMLMKNSNVKQMGLVIAATGVYDLIASNLTMLGLPQLPVTSALVDKMIPSASAPAATAGLFASYGVPQAPASPLARAGLASSYEAPDMRTAGLSGDDSPYSDILD